MHLLAYLSAAALAGCANTRTSAPIRERPRAAPVAASKPMPPVAPGYYRVQPGDTLFKIAFEYGQDVLDLATWNRVVNPDLIHGGDTLRVVPPPVATRALPAEPLVEAKMLARPVSTHAAKGPGVIPSPAEPTVAEPRVAMEDAPPDSWSWPLRGPILSLFGEGLNKGIDIAGPRGRLVQAAASGRIVYAGSGLRGYGKLIIIRHGKSLLSAYAHNERILVKEGQPVTRGQVVGEIGDSDADRVKLHFEIREFGKPVDPMNYLPKAG